MASQAWLDSESTSDVMARCYISANKHPSIRSVNKFCLAEGVVASEVTIWDVASLYPWDSFTEAGVSLEAVSSSASDTDGGVGANTLEIRGLGPNYAPDAQDHYKRDTITLNGTTPVPLTGLWSRINSDNIGIVGSTPYNVGNVDIQIAGGGQVVARIKAGSATLGYFNRTQMGVYTVPAGYHGFLITGIADLSLTGSKEVEVHFYRRLNGGENGESWQRFNTVPANDSSNLVKVREYTIPAPLPPRCDVDLRAVRTLGSTGAKVFAEFDVYLVKNEFLNA